jgi:hypothetical protein
MILLDSMAWRSGETWKDLRSSSKFCSDTSAHLFRRRMYNSSGIVNVNNDYDTYSTYLLVNSVNWSHPSSIHISAFKWCYMVLEIRHAKPLPLAFT